MAAAHPRSPLGLDAELDRLYRDLHSSVGATVEDVALARDLTVEQGRELIAPLVDQGMVKVVDGTVTIVPLKRVLLERLEEQSGVIRHEVGRLERVATALRALEEESDSPAVPADDSIRLDAEVVHGPAPLETLLDWITTGRGELMFMRPDQWRFPTEPAIAAAFKVALGQGRRARGIYPVRALHQARSVLTDRAATGEEIRLLPDVPSRLAIVGETRALLPEFPGVANERALVLRDAGLVAHLKLYFEEMWEQAVALPVFEARDVRGEARRLLLSELADGARDEQIARKLGIGLRTVRRRIAQVMLELGAESRFQAGVEAVRRGWI